MRFPQQTFTNWFSYFNPKGYPNSNKSDIIYNKCQTLIRNSKEMTIGIN